MKVTYFEMFIDRFDKYEARVQIDLMFLLMIIASKKANDIDLVDDEEVLNETPELKRLWLLHEAVSAEHKRIIRGLQRKGYAVIDLEEGTVGIAMPGLEKKCKEAVQKDFLVLQTHW